MANTIGLQTLIDVATKLVVKIAITGDGSGDETVANVVDVSTFSPAASEVKIDAVTFSLDGFAAALNWDATTDLLAVSLTGSGFFDYNPFGGLPNNAGTGKTGDVFLATNGLGSGEKGFIIVEMTKKLVGAA